LAQQRRSRRRAGPGVKSANETYPAAMSSAWIFSTSRALQRYVNLLVNIYFRTGQSAAPEDSAFEDAVSALAQLLRRLNMPPEGDIVCACLGNPNITPDSVGPLCRREPYRHPASEAQHAAGLAAFRSVSVVRPGVLGTSGIESAEYVRAFCGQVSPSFVIVVDALASADLSRLGRTLQITDAASPPAPAWATTAPR
jgi:hypothetical protein